MHTSEAIVGLLKQAESPTLEFKVNTPSPESLSRLISGFANTSGGTAIIGVREPDVIVGTNIDRFNKLVQRAKDRMHGDVELSHYSVEIEGKSIGVIDVKASKVPVASAEGYFRRVGDQEEPLNAQQLVQRMSAVPDHAAAISSLSETIAGQSIELAKLRESFEKANSWQRKVFYALIGSIATGVVKLVFAAFATG